MHPNICNYVKCVKFTHIYIYSNRDHVAPFRTPAIKEVAELLSPCCSWGTKLFCCVGMFLNLPWLFPFSLCLLLVADETHADLKNCRTALSAYFFHCFSSENCTSWHLENHHRCRTGDLYRMLFKVNSLPGP